MKGGGRAAGLEGNGGAKGRWRAGEGQERLRRDRGAVKGGGRAGDKEGKGGGRGKAVRKGGGRGRRAYGQRETGWC